MCDDNGSTGNLNETIASLRDKLSFQCTSLHTSFSTRAQGAYFMNIKHINMLPGSGPNHVFSLMGQQSPFILTFHMLFIHQ